MKCIKCIKVAKGYELNEIRRVKDIEAEERVNNTIANAMYNLTRRRVKNTELAEA